MESQGELQGKPTDRAVEAGRGALFIGIAKVFFMISGFAQKVLLAKILPAGDFGELSVINNSVSVINNTIVQGTIQSVSKFTAEDDARADAVKRAGLKLQVILGTALALGFFLAAPALAAFYKAPEYVRWFRLVALIPFFYAFYSVFVGSANGLRRFRAQAGFDMGFATAKTLLMIALGLAFGVTGALSGFVVAAVVILVVSARVMRLPGPAATPQFPVARLASFMVGIVVYTLLINLALNYDLMLLRRFAVLATTAERAKELTGYYEAVRNLALLPYQALLVVTFVIFPLVSRSTFQNDREATRAYVRQTLRYALILAAGMGVTLAARPVAVLTLLYGGKYAEGAAALPILVTGVCALALLGVSGSMINAAGQTRVAAALVAVTVAVGGGAAVAMVPNATPGAPMLAAAATATALGMAAGFVCALLYLGRRFGAGPPLPTVARVIAAVAVATAVGWVLPGKGKIAGLAALGVVGLVFFAALVLLREFGPEDRAKFRKILRR
jgi:O-antigen/teichoic acid export membrane protein